MKDPLYLFHMQRVQIIFEGTLLRVIISKQGNNNVQFMIFFHD